MQNDIKLTPFVGDKCTSIKFLIMRNLWIKNRELKLSPYKWTVCLLYELLEIVFSTIEEVVVLFKPRSLFKLSFIYNNITRSLTRLLIVFKFKILNFKHTTLVLSELLLVNKTFGHMDFCGITSMACTPIQG